MAVPDSPRRRPGDSLTKQKSRDTIISAQRDYYEVLGVAKDADQKAIKDAFRNLALKFHPDRNKEPGAEEHFKEIAEAYAILSDPKKRAEYDARGFAAVEGFSKEDLFSGINFDDIFGGLNFDFGFGGGSPFEGFFTAAAGAGTRREYRGGTGHPAGKGGARRGRKSPPQTPGDLLGLSRHWRRRRCRPQDMRDMQSTGRITHSSRKEKEHILIQQIAVCPACHGRGNIIEHPCHLCNGSGEMELDEDLTVKIPQGVEEGMALRIPGKGMPSQDRGGLSGDLFVVVRTRQDPRFERIGADLLPMKPSR